MDAWSICTDQTDVTRLTPLPYLQATLSNKGRHKIFPDGNLYTLEGRPWIGGNPFPQPQAAQEVLMANTLSWGEHDTQAHGTLDWDTDADGNVEYQYGSFYVEWQAVRRLTLDSHPYMPGHENQIRFFGGTVVQPPTSTARASSRSGAYDQRQLPGYYVYQPTTKRVRSYPVDQRFEPRSGQYVFRCRILEHGRPIADVGNFELVGKGPMLAGAHHCADLDQPNWLHKTCGGKSGVKYWRTRMELVPEAYWSKWTRAYPRAPIGKKRIWYDARTLNSAAMISYDRQGKVWKQWEGGFDYYDRKPGMTWIEGVPEHFWGWTHVHAHDSE